MEKYVPGKKVMNVLGVHQQTLYSWDKKGLIDTIRTPGGKRLYNLEKYLNNTVKNNVEETKEIDNDNEANQMNICYCRVSTVGQKDDLKRQIEYMKSKYPKHDIIQDVGSGLNFKRKGLNKIINLAIEGKIKEIVVAHKDRLTRFGYELIENILVKYSSGKIIILDDKKLEPEEELMRDMMQIMNVFVAKMNGMRKYRKK